MRNNTPRRWALTAATLTLLATACSGPLQDTVETTGQPAEQLAYTANPDFCDPLIEFGTLSLVETDSSDLQLDAEQIVTSFTTAMLESDQLNPADREQLEQIKEDKSLESETDMKATAEQRLTMFNRMADACDAEPAPLYTGFSFSEPRDLESAIDFCQFIENDESNMMAIVSFPP